MLKHKLKRGAVPLLAAAMLAAGCTKEASVPGLSIFEEGMNGVGSKVLVDPSNPTSNRWLADNGFIESIGIYDGSTAAIYDIQGSGNDFYVNYTGEGNNMVAWYPNDAAGYYSTSDWKVHYCYPTSTNSVTVGWEASYRQRNDGKIQMQFPMVAFADAGSTSLMFRHISGAVAFNVTNNTGNDITINTIHVEAKSGGNPVYLWPHIKDDNGDGVNDGNGFVCSKSGTGMTINYLNTPSAENSCDNYCAYYIEKEGGLGIPLANGESFLCILPIPVTEVATDFTLTAQSLNTSTYQTENICQRTISGLTIARNHMYNLPTFNLAD